MKLFIKFTFKTAGTKLLEIVERLLFFTTTCSQVSVIGYFRLIIFNRLPAERMKTSVECLAEKTIYCKTRYFLAHHIFAFLNFELFEHLIFEYWRNVFPILRYYFIRVHLIFAISYEFAKIRCTRKYRVLQ